MNFLRKATSLFKGNKNESDGEKTVNTIKKLLMKKIGFTLLFPVILFLLIFMVLLSTLLTNFGYKLDMMQVVDGEDESTITEGVVYDEATLEEYFQLSEKAYESSNKPSDDLSSTTYGSVESFNKHIKDTVCMHGYGTRQGVVAAGMSLIGDYIKSTGKRIRYDQSGRQQPGVEGIVNSDFYLDCSGFSWWALYNGGFNLPDVFAQTDYLYAWAAGEGITKEATSGGGQGGDFLVTRGKGHIMLIVGTYSDGYYIAEEAGWGYGGKISKYSYSSLGGYVLMDMTSYYNNSSNVRPNSYTCPKIEESDISYSSGDVKSSFSSGTLQIIKNHLNDFDAKNFNSVISSYGGFSNYAKSLGGIFGDYYGKSIRGRSKADFRTAAEYVLGWMYMYGWDYTNDAGSHAKWGGKNYSSDAFYAKGGYVGKYKHDSSDSRGRGTNFDNVISGKNGGAGRMASECGDLEVFIYNKLGIQRNRQLSKVTKLKDLKVGDCIYFFDHKVDKTSERNWGTGVHNVVVGEVYSDRIVCYDAGKNYPETRNYKRTIWLPDSYSEEADYAAVKKTFGYSGWGMRRWYNFS